MFQRFTERARRVIFFARYEAGMYGAGDIASEHFLLGILRERLGPGEMAQSMAEAIRASIPNRKPVSTQTDLPLAAESSRILNYALEEADASNNAQVYVAHLLLGILREDKCNASQVLREHGLTLDVMRGRLSESIAAEAQPPHFAGNHDDPGKRAMMAHMLATLAYRVRTALAGAPAVFADFRAGVDVRTPHELIRHMIEVLNYARGRLLGRTLPAHSNSDFADDLDAFYQLIKDLNGDLRSPLSLLVQDAAALDRILQGPFSDAMTHAGQLALLRRLAGSPVPQHNFFNADIDPNKL